MIDTPFPSPPDAENTKILSNSADRKELTAITAGLLTRPEAARDLRRSERTIIRYENAGMPVIRLGMLRLYDPASCRKWLMTHERRHQQPRRGRPTKRAA